MTSRFPAVDVTAADLVSRVLARSPTLGAGRLVCVDGPAGSGKTTLAAALNRGFRDALRAAGAPADPAHVRLLHMDNVFAGWTGLTDGMRTMATDVVGPLREGRPGRYRRFDWVRERFAEERVVAPVDVLLIEGVGSGSTAYAGATTMLVWVHTPADVRLERGVARDGEQLRGRWAAWSDQEAAMFARERTRSRADVVVDGRTGDVEPTATRPHVATGP